MRRFVVTAVLASTGWMTAGAHAQTPAVPLGFEPNRGQAGGDVRYVGATPDGVAFLERAGAQLRLGRGERVALRPRGARTGARVTAAGRLPGVVNRIHGDDPRDWQLGLPMYRRVRQHGLYPGIDLAFHFRQGALEYDWILAPGARARTIDLAVDGGRKLRLTRRGDLLVTTREGVLRQRRPVAYQRVDGRRRAVAVRFVLRGKRRIDFAVGAHDRSRPLVIDPVVTFSTYLGGADADAIQDVATDPSGYVYVSGSTRSLDFPTKDAYDSGCGTGQPVSCNHGSSYGYPGGASDAFVAKLDPTGSSLIYATYLGGSSYESAVLDVDAQGRAHLFGGTSSFDFPVTPGALVPTRGTCKPATPYQCSTMFVTRLTAAGGLDWSTYFGHSEYDGVGGIAVGPDGSVFLTGYAGGNFPRTVGALGAAAREYGEMFVSKLAATGTQLLWSGLFGSSYDSVADIDVTAGGEPVLAGTTDSSEFYVTAGAAQTRCDGPGRAPDDSDCDSDVWVGRVKADGSGFAYSTLLGGNGGDHATGIALDAGDRPIVTGSTWAPDFPKASPLGPGRTSGGFVSRLSATGSAIEYSGMTGPAVPRDVAIAADGGAYLAGTTPAGLLDVRDAVQPDPGSKACYAAGYDRCTEAFLARVSPDGRDLRWATYVGGSGTETAAGVAAQGGGAIVAGTTTSVDFPLHAALDPALNAGTCRDHEGCASDGFVTRVDDAGTARAPHDTFETRRRLHAVAGSVHGHARGGTIWFDWTAPANRTVAFDTAGSSFGASLTVHRGSSAGSLSTVAGGGSRVTWRAVRGRSYKIALSGGSGGYTLRWEGAPPSNDDFEDAQALAGASGAAGGNTVYATQQPGEPPVDAYSPRSTIWYAWTAPQSGKAVFSTEGSDAMNGLSVWRGDHLDVLEQVASAPASVFTVTEGVTYRIRVEAWGGLAGDVELRWRFSPRPANDDLTMAQEISGTSGSVEAEPFAATAELQEPMHGTEYGGQSVWYRWTAPARGAYAFRAVSRGWANDLVVYTGTAYGNLKRVASTEDGYPRTFGTEAGRTYLIVVDSYSTFQLEWKPAPSPANDLFSTPMVLDPQQGQIRIDSALATTEADEPLGYASTWYSWTAPASGSLLLDMTMDNGDAPGLVVYTGGSLTTLTEVGRPGTYYADTLALAVTAGTTYRIRLEGGHRRHLAWDFGPPPNDAFAAAQVISGGAGTVTGTIANSTLESGESADLGRTTWYSWTAPATGNATFTTDGGEVMWGVAFQVVKGDSLATLTHVAAGSWNYETNEYKATFPVTAGTTYRIRLYGGNLTGTLRLSWNQRTTETTPPEVEVLLGPGPNYARGTQVTLRAHAFDRNAVKTLEFLVNGAVVGAARSWYDDVWELEYWDSTKSPNGDVQVTARATDRWGNVGTSAPVTVRVDNLAPDTTITSAPSGTTSARTATATFALNDAVGGFMCRIDEEAWFECSDTLKIEHLEDGRHILLVRGYDAAGNSDPVPARAEWVVEGAEADPAPEPTPTPDPELPPEPTPEPSPDPGTGGGGGLGGGGGGLGGSGDGGGGGGTGGGGFVPLPGGGGTVISKSTDGELRLSASVPTGRLTAAVLRRGLPVRLSCSAGCRVTARLALSGSQARRARLKAGTVARAARTLSAGDRLTVRLRPSARVARALGRRRGVRVQLVVGAVTPEGSRTTIRRTLVVR